MRLLIVGCGYVGGAVVKHAPPDWEICALTRSAARADELKQQNLSPIVGDWLQASTLTALPSVDFVLVSVPHRPVDDLAEAAHRIGLEHLLQRLPAGWRKWVYLSTTGVYGDARHEVVDEETPVSSTRVGPQIALAAERWLDQHMDADQLTILRLAGIYGPGRVPLAAKLRAGEALAVPQDGFLNLVHVTDIARMIHRVFEATLDRSCYVFSDGQPVLRADFYQYLAELCGVPQPVFAEPDPNDSRARRATSKRVSPQRLVAATDFEFQVPSYREGLVEAVES